MVLSAEGPNKASEEVLSALEGNLMSRGIRVVSSGMTGRVVSDPGLLQGATQLSQLERAIVLAKKANINCVFQVQRLDIGIRSASRYYHLNLSGRGLQEVPSDAVSTLDPARLWTLTGPVWDINGKVIDVENGDVLAIIDISQSSVCARPTQIFRLQSISDVPLPTATGQKGWRIDDTELLAKSMMSLLATIIAGPLVPSAADPWGDKNPSPPR
jgi:hypothetical protein